MKGLRNSIAYCVKENKQCVGWVEKYFKDCLCNFNDELSFAFGLISLVCWGVAEIPQIITNFRTKSSHGVSLLFLLTWIAGDVFNLVGCLLEPATLPTQFYTALLYTASTVVLMLQSLYYDHLYGWLKAQRIEHNQGVEEERKFLKPPKPYDSAIPIPGGTPIMHQPHREIYYVSARSLAWTNTLPTRSPLRAARSGPPSVMGLKHDSSSDDEPIRASSHKSRSKPKPIPRSAGSAAFLAASISLPSGSKALMHVYMGLSGRRLLQIKRGSVEGKRTLPSLSDPDVKPPYSIEMLSYPYSEGHTVPKFIKFDGKQGNAREHVVRFIETLAIDSESKEEPPGNDIVEIEHVPRSDNKFSDALTTLVVRVDIPEEEATIVIKKRKEPSIILEDKDLPENWRGEVLDQL
ncbi:hypothetical protein HYC85_005397 [Camellia sinensis]|uniref:Uncharacterized protein n=1 Tax=Camellia sinensis TaxID=4442 RepID=A0A7J7HZE1_CAMSI|nr:hypothetical protein HYC85_005397 [Camellia sinensis]